MNFRPMFEFPSGERVGNAQVFATHDEAESSAKNRFFSWTMPIGYGVDETDDPVTYRWDINRGDVSLPLQERNGGPAR